MPVNLPQTFLDEEDVPAYFQRLDGVQKRCAAAMLAQQAPCSGPSVVARYFGSAARTAAVTAPQTLLRALKGSVGAALPLVQTAVDFAFLTAQNSHDFAWSDATRSVLEGVTRYPDVVGTLLSRDVASAVVQLANQQIFSRASGSGLTWLIETARGIRSGVADFAKEFRRVRADRE